MQTAGTTVKGKITRITGYGAFVSIDGGGSGMIHISEVSKGYVKDIKEHLTEGQEVEAFVISCDENGRLNLSLRRLAPKHDFTAAPPEVSFLSEKSESFEEMMHRFKSVSDDKMGDLKRGYENKRGNKRRR